MCENNAIKHNCCNYVNYFLLNTSTDVKIVLHIIINDSKCTFNY